MKHNLKITIILISMFIITQLIGLYVVDFYNNEDNKLPYGMEPPDEVKADVKGVGLLFHILFAFVFAIFLFLILTKIDAERFIRAWFFIVVAIALGIIINIFTYNLFRGSGLVIFSSFIALFFAIPLAYLKIFRRDILVHNITELFIYPGIAAVFVPIINILGIIILLLIISLYDIWAVWHSEFMKKMAQYQINNLKFFTGFFVPYAGKKEKLKIKKLKERYSKKSEKFLERQLKKARIRINLAILGGGDIIFPIITAGVFMKIGGLLPALIITASATLALLFLFILARKGKFYPAMPFLTIGMYLGIIVNWAVF